MRNRFYDSGGKKRITISASQESIEAVESSIESEVALVQLTEQSPSFQLKTNAIRLQHRSSKK
jgi:hypothetical protein